jgi:hypothetical protein
VADCCHSGDDATWHSPVEIAPVGALPRGLPRGLADRVYDRNAAMYNMQPRLRVPRTEALRAAVLLLSSCQAGELSFEGPERGLFTGALLASIPENAPSYDALMQRLNERTPRCQTPGATMLSGGRVDLRRGVQPFHS